MIYNINPGQQSGKLTLMTQTKTKKTVLPSNPPPVGNLCLCFSMCSSRLSLTHFELESLQKQDPQKGDPAVLWYFFCKPLSHQPISKMNDFNTMFMGFFSIERSSLRTSCNGNMVKKKNERTRSALLKHWSARAEFLPFSAKKNRSQCLCSRCTLTQLLDPKNHQKWDVQWNIDETHSHKSKVKIPNNDIQILT